MELRLRESSGHWKSFDPFRCDGNGAVRKRASVILAEHGDDADDGCGAEAGGDVQAD